MSKNNVAAVLGSPSFSDDALLAQVLDHYVQPGQTVLTNEAGGASLLARVWCRKYQAPFQVIPAERGKEYVAWAENNVELAEKCDAMIVFWDGGSIGAIDAAWKADMAGKNVLIVQVGPVGQAEWKDRLSQRLQRAS